jgi:hypothetical protein
LLGKNSHPFCFNGRVVEVLELLELAEVIPKVGDLVSLDRLTVQNKRQTTQIERGNSLFWIESIEKRPIFDPRYKRRQKQMKSCAKN